MRTGPVSWREKESDSRNLTTKSNAMNATTSTRPEELIESVIEILDLGEALLVEISDDAYTRKVPVAFNASIGGHYRHCLDHFRSLLDASAGGDLDYDRRERGTPIECDRFAALNATRMLRERFALLDPTRFDRSLNVTCKASYGATGSQTVPSTMGREIMYSVAHAVHHCALIGIMAGLMRISLPAGFGIAPSTLKHQSQKQAA